MTRHVALLRGINLARERRVAMPALRDVVAGLGYDGVRTFLQSGNVVFTSDAPADEVERELERAIASELGVETDVFVRTRDELAAVVDRNPLADVVDEPKWYQVSFLASEPDPERVRALAAADLAPERLVVLGREAYAWHAGGIQRSKLAKLLADDRALGVRATARNWNTVTRLLAVADS